MDLFHRHRTDLGLRPETLWLCVACFLLISSKVPCQGASGCFSAPAGLVGWWAGDGNGSDIVGTNNGTLQGGATATAVGVVGSAFSFDGTNAYVQIPDSPTLKPTNLTVEAWILFSGLDSSGNANAGQQYIVFKQNSISSPFEGYDLGKFRVTGTGDIFAFRVTASSGASAQLYSSTVINTGVWYHVAGVRGSNYLQLYVNGQLERQTNVSFAQNYGTLPLFFGSSGQTYWDRKFKGVLDEVSLYNRALSSNEVASVWAAGAAGKCKGVSLTAPPQSQTVVLGSSATFTVTATGYGSLNYQWQFNGAPLAGSTGTSLVLTNVQLTNAGNYAVVVSNTLGAVTSSNALLTVLVPPIFTNQPASTTNIVGTTAAFSVLAGGGAPLSYQWRFNGGIIPGATNTSLSLPNVQFAAAGGYSVVVTNAAGAVTSTVASLAVICPVVTLSPPSVPSGTVGVGYSQSLTASGGEGPYVYSIISGALPGGLAVSVGGVLSGTPTTPGSFSFVARATDTNSCSGTNGYSVAIACPNITVGPATVPAGTAGAAYNQTLTASGGASPYTFSAVSNSLPSWLALSVGGGLSGTPPSPGSFSFAVRAADANGCSGTNSYTVTVGCPAIIVGPGTLPGGTAGAAYNTTLTASGGASPYTFSAVSNSLPSWLALSVGGGLSGTPPSPGSFSFAVRAADTNGCSGTNSYTVTVGCPAINVGPGTLPGGTAGAAYNTTLTASGGASPYTFSALSNSLPSWLALSVGGGLSGTPPSPGSFSFAVRAADTNGCSGTNSYTVTVGCPAILVGPGSLPGGTAGAAYNTTLTASGGASPYTFSAVSNSLPSWLALSVGGGLSGTPPSPGSFSFAVRAADTNGCSGTNSYTVTVGCPAILVGPGSLPGGTAGAAYNTTLTASGGASPYTFSAVSNSLPSWLGLAVGGGLSGAPPSPGSFSFAVRAADTNGCSGTNSYTVTVGCPAILVGPGGLPGGTAGAAYNATLTASGGAPPYTFSVVSNSLPSWLGLSVGGGLSGTPPSPGSFSFAVRAADTNGCSGTNSYTVTVGCPAITVGPATLPDGLIGSGYSQSLVATGGAAPYSFAVTAGGLPLGLSLSTAGALTGTPTGVGTTNLTVTATDANGCVGVQSYGLVVAGAIPNISLQPQSRTNVVGTTASFSVQANGTVPLSYQWQFNGGTIAGATSTNLVLTNVQFSAAGAYRVIVTNVVGAATSAVASLTVSCPAITLSPATLPNGLIGTGYAQALTAVGGFGTYSFSVTAGGLPPGLSLSSAGVVSGTPTAVISTNLTVTATDTNGCGGSQSYALAIAGAAPAIALQPQSQTNAVGTTARFSAAATGTLPLSFQWQFNGAAISGATSTNLTLPNVPFAAAGGYRVVVTNQAGSATSAVATLTVICPSITLSPGSLQSAMVGVGWTQALTAISAAGPCSFGVTAGGLPAGLSLSGAGILAGIPAATGSTNFTVTATDTNGCNGSQTYALLVTGAAPLITLHPQSLTNVVGTSASFNAAAIGAQPLNYQWQLNGAALSGATASNLTLNNVQTTNAGAYNVVVTNLAGAATSGVASLTVWVPPAILSAPSSLGVVGGATASFSVVATGSPTVAYQWRLNGKNLTDGLYYSGSTSSNLTISYVLWASCRSQAISVVVSNAVGAVTSPPVVLTVTAPQFVPFRDPNLQAAVCAALAKPLGALAVTNLSALTSLTACGQHLTDLAGLEYAANLRSLLVPNNGITDLSPLQCLNTLGQLALYHNHITDLSPLASLTSLTNLNVADNSVADASALAGLTALTSVSLGGNLLGNVSSLTNLMQLSALTIDRNNLTDISPLTNLTGLSSLAAGGNPALTNYEALERLPGLSNLSLRNSPIVRLGDLRNLNQLSSLDLYSTPVLSLSPLTNLVSLTRLDLSWDASITNCAMLARATGLTNLCLRGVPATNVAFLTNLSRLTYLNLDSTRMSDASPLGGLTNLTYLTLTGNPAITNFGVLSNLTSLVNLEARANSISNVAFMAGLSRLAYADLAYNNLTDLSSLAGLTNLSSVVLAGNPNNNYASLPPRSTLTNLWLFDNTLSDASFVTGLRGLNYLNLERNRLTSLAPLSALPNLAGLGLSGNPITNYSPLAGLTKLTSLRLDGSSNLVGNLSFLTNLAQLTFLSLNKARLTDLSPLAGLPTLNDLYLQRNEVAAVPSLAALPRLLNVDVSLNFLDLTSNSAPAGVVQALLRQGATVASQPQNQPPSISLPILKWFISSNTNSSLAVPIFEDPLPGDDQLVVTATSSNPGLVAVVNNPLPGTNYSRVLTLAGGNPASQTVSVTLTVTNDVGLSANATLQVAVVSNAPLANLCPSLAPDVAGAISASALKPVSDLTAVDLLSLTSLALQNANPDGACVWQWLTNLTSLSLNGNSISNVAFLTNQTHLTSLAAFYTATVDFSPLAGLTNLTSLSVAGGSVSNLSFLTNLTQLTSLSLYNTSTTDFSPLANLTNLVSLALYGEAIASLNSLSNLAGLTYLTLYKTRITDLAPLAGLTNLQLLHLQQNRIASISALTNLPALFFADLTLNLLDLSANSPAMRVIQALANTTAVVSYLPQRQPPLLSVNPNWFVETNTLSSVYFGLSVDTLFTDVSVGASSANTNLVPNSSLLAGLIPDEWQTNWFLNVLPASNQFGSTTITLAATNDAGLGASASFLLTVDTPASWSGAIFTDTNFTTWVTGTNAPWFGQASLTHGGVPAAQSASISNNAASWLQSTVTGPGTLSFWWKVSSETNYDLLTFYVGTNGLAQISGEVDWQQRAFSFAPGLETLTWEYSKDKDTTEGMDAGWVAQVTFTPTSWVQLNSRPTNAQCVLTLYGVAGRPYEVQASTNVVDWSQAAHLKPTVLATNRAAMPFTDTNAVPPARFYRLRDLSP